MGMPLLIQKMFANPGQLQEDFLNFLEAAKLPPQLNEKTIAYASWYQQKSVSGASSGKFFTGTYTAADTNMPSDFVHPQSEHNVVWAIRVSSVIDLSTQAYYTPGVSGDPSLDNATLTVINNGEVVLQSFPLAEALQDLTTKDNGIIELAEPFVWAAQTTLKMELEAADGQSFTTDLNVRLNTIGLGLVS